MNKINEMNSQKATAPTSNYKEPGIFTCFGEWLSKNSVFLIGFPLFIGLSYVAVAYLSKNLLVSEYVIYAYAALGVLVVAVFLIATVGLFIYERLNAVSRAIGNWLGMN